MQLAVEEMTSGGTHVTYGDMKVVKDIIQIVEWNNSNMPPSYALKPGCKTWIGTSHKAAEIFLKYLHHPCKADNDSVRKKLRSLT